MCILKLVGNLWVLEHAEIGVCDIYTTRLYAFYGASTLFLVNVCDYYATLFECSMYMLWENKKEVVISIFQFRLVSTLFPPI